MGKSTDYIGIYDFARLANKSPQWVYKMLRNKPELKKYTKTVNGKNKIHVSALWDVFGIQHEQLSLDKYTPDKQDDEPKDPLTVALTDQIQTLKQQLETKDQHIEKLQDTIQSLTETIRVEQILRANADQRIAALTAQLEDLREKSDNSQADDSTKDTACADPEEETAKEGNTTGNASSDKNHPTNSSDVKSGNRRKAFFDWLFRR